MINSYWSLLEKGVQWFLIQGVKLEHILELGKISRLNLNLNSGCNVSRRHPWAPRPMPMDQEKMQPNSHRYYLLKFGMPTSPAARLEVRNEALELIGVCPSQDHVALGKLLQMPLLPEKIITFVQALEIGKIAMMTL